MSSSINITPAILSVIESHGGKRFLRGKPYIASMPDLMNYSSSVAVEDEDGEVMPQYLLGTITGAYSCDLDDDALDMTDWDEAFLSQLNAYAAEAVQLAGLVASSMIYKHSDTLFPDCIRTFTGSPDTVNPRKILRHAAWILSQTAITDAGEAAELVYRSMFRELTDDEKWCLIYYTDDPAHLTQLDPDLEITPEMLAAAKSKVKLPF